MTSRILITGATDGIGLATAQALAGLDHRLVLHGRNEEKLERAAHAVQSRGRGAVVGTVVADFADLAEVERLADDLLASGDSLDVVINNAGVYRTPETRTADGLDTRFVVNTIAPYLLTRRLLPLLADTSRVINLSSAAQAPVDLDALTGRVQLDDMGAYAQSKLALTAWSRHLALELGHTGPSVIAINPGSLLATTMVKEGFGVEGNDIGIGVDILVRAALSDEFAAASGTYYDNDARRFADPHPDALDPVLTAAVVQAIDAILAARPGREG